MLQWSSLPHLSDVLVTNCTNIMANLTEAPPEPPVITIRDLEEVTVILDSPQRETLNIKTENVSQLDFQLQTASRANEVFIILISLMGILSPLVIMTYKL